MGQSRNEDILENMLGASNPLGEPRSREEALLMQLLDKSGSSGHNYSTEEQIVGTWIDGSTIYEKTVHKSNSQSTFVDFEDIETMPNTNEVLSIEFTAKRELQNNEYMYYTGCGSVMPEYSNGYKISTRFYNSNLQYYIAGYGAQITDLWITIRYTKTST